MSLPILTPGVAIRESAPLNLDFHVRANHVSQLSEKPKPFDFGFIEYWVNTHKEEHRGFALSLKDPQSVQVTNSKIYTYEVARPADICRLIGDYSDIPDLGRGEQEFEIKLTHRIAGETGIIAFSYTGGPELIVTEPPTKVVGSEGWIYKVKIFNVDEVESIDPRYLKHETPVFRRGSLRGPNSGGAYDDANFLNGPGKAQYAAHISDGFANVVYSIGEEALLSIPDNRVVEFWRLADGQAISGNTLVWSDLFKQLGGPQGIRKAIEKGYLEVSWMTLLEYQAMKKLDHDLREYTVWGRGGLLKDAGGKEDLRLHEGLWRQFKRGPEVVYSLDTFSLDMLETEIRNHYRGKIDFDDPMPKLKVIVRTGHGGMRLINRAIEAKAFGKGFSIDAVSIGAITGERMTKQYGLGFTSYIIPGLATIEFVHDSALDVEQDSDIDNPRIAGGFRLSSYTMLVHDYNTESGSDNIQVLKYGGPKSDRRIANMVRMRVNQGTLPYGGFDKLQDRVPFESMSDQNGFAVKIETRYPTVVVKDPTRILRFTMRNPITGLTM
jgi:hypothetical protein